MYQEIKTDSLASLWQALEAAIPVAPEQLSVTLKKRGNDFEATLFQVGSEPSVSS